MEKIGNNYGAALTTQDCVDMYKDQKMFREALTNNLGMRIYLSGRGFSRVGRAFADEVIRLATTN